MNSNQRNSKSGKFSQFAMMACCAIMIAPIVFFLLAGGQIGGIGDGLAVFAPLAICVGAHLLMHRFMGKSCHHEKDDEKIDAAAIKVAANDGKNQAKM